MKQEWGDEQKTARCIMIQETGLIWSRLRMRKMRVTRRGQGKRRSPSYNEQGTEIHAFLKCYGTEMEIIIFE
jgi:hypothetical protein